MKSNNSICIIDYGMGNVSSVQNSLRRLGCEAQITSDQNALAAADGLILPGVGAFALAMANLRELGLVDFLTEQVEKKHKPILGICLGMQLMAESSTEGGEHQGLGWIPGKVIKLEARDLPVPHVGWNNNVPKSDSLIFARIQSGTHYYFDHSYYFDGDGKYILSTVDYGREIASAIGRDNVLGVQFHPEKSQVAGLKLLRNFLNFVADAGGRA